MEALMIGVSGMRGTIGGTLTPLVISRMAGAFAAWLKGAGKPANGKHFCVVLGRDSRPSGTWVRDAAAASPPSASCRRRRRGEIKFRARPGARHLDFSKFCRRFRDARRTGLRAAALHISG